MGIFPFTSLTVWGWSVHGENYCFFNDRLTKIGDDIANNNAYIYCLIHLNKYDVWAPKIIALKCENIVKE